MNKPQLREAGSECHTCRKFWLAQNRTPKRLVHVFTDDGRRMLTDNKQIPIVVCPYCDGDAILKLSKDVPSESV